MIFCITFALAFEDNGFQVAFSAPVETGVKIKRAIFDKIFIDREVVQEASACFRKEMSAWVKEWTVKKEELFLEKVQKDFDKFRGSVLNQINSWPYLF